MPQGGRDGGAMIDYNYPRFVPVESFLKGEKRDTKRDLAKCNQRENGTTKQRKKKGEESNERREKGRMTEREMKSIKERQVGFGEKNKLK